jgi:hypothetical protein
MDNGLLRKKNGQSNFAYGDRKSLNLGFIKRIIMDFKNCLLYFAGITIYLKFIGNN